VPYPPHQAVIPLGEHLLHPLHNLRQGKSVLRLDVKRKLVILKPEAPDLEREAEHRFLEDPVEQGRRP
jgi:hypothetical protein